MNNVVSFRAKRYAKMQAEDVFWEITGKEEWDAEDEMFLNLAIKQLGLSKEDLIELAELCETRAKELLAQQQK